MTAEKTDQEVAQLIEGTYRRVKNILADRRWALERITAELQLRETIGRDDLERVLAEVGSQTKPVVA
jgi:cell division protease FtsH